MAISDPGRTPTAHKASHATGGSDALAAADVGAASTGALTAEASAREAADKAVAAAYRTLFSAAGGLSIAGASGKKYMLVPANIDQEAPVSAGSASRVSFLFPIAAADLAVSGLTPKLRLSLIGLTTTAPAVTVTFGLYPVAVAGTITAGTVVAGSTVAMESPAANGAVQKQSADFAVPSDGIYAVGYTVSGTPAGSLSVQAAVQIHHV